MFDVHLAGVHQALLGALALNFEMQLFAHLQSFDGVRGWIVAEERGGHEVAAFEDGKLRDEASVGSANFNLCSCCMRQIGRAVDEHEVGVGVLLGSAGEGCHRLVAGQDHAVGIERLR